MPNQVPAAVSTARAARLDEFCRRLHSEFCEGFVGKQADVLFESTMRGGMMYGYTGNYVRVKTPYRRDLINVVSCVKLLQMDENGDVLAEIIA